MTDSHLTDQEMLERFDDQLRRTTGPPLPGWTVERLGGVLRSTPPIGLAEPGFVDAPWLTAAEADAAIAEHVAWFAARGQSFEWKTFAHDAVTDLPERLLAAGFVPEDLESLVLGRTADVIAACDSAPPPTGVLLRHAVDADWPAIRDLHELIWGGDWHWLVEGLAAELADRPEALKVHVAEAEGEIVCAAWVRLHARTDFASLWGGGTHPAWRRRGIYRALVGRRAHEAAERGHTLLQVDASPDSRPVLERLGLRVVSTTTPYVWTPPTP